ncbi:MULTISPECIES: very short patch repair endonuclease [Mesobacillus]|uniref:Very short patch repair endonuclease n=1 Tax=Mesobacillus selenatarsenatis (strain DSM 18680 / JCM 14380 / FERM P-15431 / SF-1) TaxID=1321606 RepID=A0A0A8WWW9_MESS1|nr:very short patch repair endonuclease [Mesobacillus selenatarsenatis]GAM12155.1 Very-short-patch mismatch repair endonuclease (G-T specific) [Mesobacillus selenatarsenatis SF-1]
MVDQQRSKIMSSIKAVSKLESLVTQELWKKGLRFRRNVRGMVGTPDIAIKKYKVVIFIDSCFWHFCPIHGKMPKSNIDFWKKKLERNQERDKEHTQFYLQKGWHILRIWEHEIRQDFDKTIEKIATFIEDAKSVEAI